MPMSERELEEVLKENLRLSRENNRLLRTMRRDEIIGRFIKLFIIILVIAVPIGVYYYFMKPYVDELRQTYKEVQESAESIKALQAGLPNLPQWAQDLIGSEDHGTTSTTSI